METKQLFTIKEFLAFHPASRATVYAEIGSGRLIARKMGGKTVILASDYRAYLDALPRVELKTDDDAGVEA